MKLENKITLITFILSFFVLATVAFFYSLLNYGNIIKSDKEYLLYNTQDLTNALSMNLHDHISNALTITTSPFLKDYLITSNQFYSSKSKDDIKNHIKNLNTRWMNSKLENEFIQHYLTNDLAKFLKEQQKILPDTYGEIFITNKYGAMVASTGKLTTLAHLHKYWWQKAYNNGKGKIFLDDRGFDDSVGGYVIGIVVPIFHDNTIIGVLKANVNIVTFLRNIVQKYNISHNSEVLIARTKGLIVYEENIEPLSTQLPDSIQNLITTMKLDVIQKTIDKTKYILSFTPVKIEDSHYDIEFGGKISTIDHSKGNKGEQWHIIIKKPLEMTLKNYSNTNNIILFTGLLLIIISGVISYFFGRLISKKQIEVENKLKNYNTTLQNEIETRTEELQVSNEKLQYALRETKKLNDTLEESNKILDLKVEEKTKENLEKERILLEQSKMAHLGEMLGNIAHQWRQPLSIISTGATGMLMQKQYKELSDEQFEKMCHTINNNAQFLSQTIDTFTNFIKEKKEYQEVVLQEKCDEILTIVKASLHNNNIELRNNIDYNTPIKIKMIVGELSQVVINILNNAKDAIIAKNIENGWIEISLTQTDNKVIISIEDNAGGIPEDIIAKIFEPYFTTKHKSQGTGLGLYMSYKIITESLNGKLYVENTQNGAKFFIELTVS